MKYTATGSWMWTQASLSLNARRKWEVQMVGFKQSPLFALRVSRLFAGEEGPLRETGSLINELLSSLSSFLPTFPPSARHTVQQPPLGFYVCPRLIWKKHLCQEAGLGMNRKACFGCMDTSWHSSSICQNETRRSGDLTTVTWSFI